MICAACGTAFGADLYPDECPDCGTLYGEALIAEARPPAQRHCGTCGVDGHNTSECPIDRPTFSGVLR